MPVKGLQPCITDVDNAAMPLIECMSKRDYDKSNNECQKTEFEFINRTSNFRTSFNNPSVDCIDQIECSSITGKLHKILVIV